MTWTTEKPEQPGKYLYRTRYSFARTVRVSRRRDGWWCTFPDGSSSRLEYCNGEFYRPIDPEA